MEHIPDAPYIREAEDWGMPPYETVKCPVCGEECTEIYADMYGTVFGCNQCIMTQDAWDWAEEQKEADRPDDD